MTTIGFNFQAKNPKGEELKEEVNHLGKILANAVFQANKGNSVKLYDWGLKLWNNEALTLDDTDFDVLRTFIDQCEGMNIFCKGQLLKIMDSQKTK